MSYSLKNTNHTYIGNSHFKTFLKRAGLYMIVVCSALQMTSQTKVSKALEQDALQAALHLSQGALAIENNEFITAEVAYRKAIAIEENKATGSYNLGNAYYKNSKNEEALSRFVNAAKVATTKPQRHQAFHNLGNALMNQKEYSGAVEAYKNALRNNPSDDQSRYNLALAKDLLEKTHHKKGRMIKKKSKTTKTKKISKIKRTTKTKTLRTTKIQKTKKGMSKKTKKSRRNLKTLKTSRQNKTNNNSSLLMGSCLPNR